MDDLVKEIRCDIAKRLGVDDKELDRMYDEAFEYNRKKFEYYEDLGEDDDYLNYVEFKCLLCFRLHYVNRGNLWLGFNYCDDCIERILIGY
jgi:hypothetical protein